MLLYIGNIIIRIQDAYLNQVGPFLLQLSLLLENYNAQKLVLQALHGDSKVDDACPGRYLRGVRRISQLGRDVDTEPRHNV